MIGILKEIPALADRAECLAKTFSHYRVTLDNIEELPGRIKVARICGLSVHEVVYQIVYREEYAKEVRYEDVFPPLDALSQAFPDIPIGTLTNLVEADYDTVTAIEQAPDEDLLKIKGIGKRTLQILRGATHDHS